MMVRHPFEVALAANTQARFGQYAKSLRMNRLAAALANAVCSLLGRLQRLLNLSDVFLDLMQERHVFGLFRHHGIRFFGLGFGLFHQFRTQFV